LSPGSITKPLRFDLNSLTEFSLSISAKADAHDYSKYHAVKMLSPSVSIFVEPASPGN
jgi:hypothetical protein